jgi:hypothetical protein
VETGDLCGKVILRIIELKRESQLIGSFLEGNRVSSPPITLIRTGLEETDYQILILTVGCAIETRFRGCRLAGWQDHCSNHDQYYDCFEAEHELLSLVDEIILYVSAL